MRRGGGTEQNQKRTHGEDNGRTAGNGGWEVHGNGKNTLKNKLLKIPFFYSQNYLHWTKLFGHLNIALSHLHALAPASLLILSFLSQMSFWSRVLPISVQVLFIKISLN